MKKLINDPFDFVEEMLDGFCAAHSDLIRRVGRRAIARVDAPIPGKVGVVVGGGVPVGVVVGGLSGGG